MAKTEHTQLHESVEQSSHQTSDAGFFSPDTSMLVLTWITFFCLLAILHKFAWKPILASLEQREQNIRKSVEEAEAIAQEMKQLQDTKKRQLLEAETRAKEIIEEGRKAAREAARSIQEKSKEESLIMLENARREIKEASEKAQADLRLQSANIAVELASKILGEKIDSQKDQELIERYLKDL